MDSLVPQEPARRHTPCRSTCALHLSTLVEDPMVDVAFLGQVATRAAKLAIELRPTARSLGKPGATRFASALSSADILLQEQIIRDLKGQYPDVPIVGEEATRYSHRLPPLDQHEYFVVDPIDGTYLFLRESPLYAVQVAFVSRDEYVVAAAALPAFGVCVESRPWRVAGHIEPLPSRTAFVSAETGDLALEGLRVMGYSPLTACSLLCMLGPLIWPDSIGLYSREPSIRGKVGLAMASQGGALILASDLRPIKEVRVSGLIGPTLVAHPATGAMQDRDLRPLFQV